MAASIPGTPLGSTETQAVYAHTDCTARRSAGQSDWRDAGPDHPVGLPVGRVPLRGAVGQATPATEGPVMLAKLRPYAPWLGLLACASGCLLTAPVAFIAGWFYGAGHAQLADAPATLAALAAQGKALQDWNFQDLQDHLAAKGIKTERCAGRMGPKRGMWYAAAILPENRALLTDPDPSYAALFLDNDEGGFFFVEDAESISAARRLAATLRDVQQRDVLATGHFVVHGAPARLAALRKVLP